MTQLYKKVTRGKTVHTKIDEIKQIRMRCGYSIGDMALILGIPKSTYQCYEDGSRQTPLNLIPLMEEIERRDKEFFARYLPGGAYEQELNRMFPEGIRC